MLSQCSGLLKEQIERAQCMSTFTLYTESSRGTVSWQLSKVLRRFRIFLVEGDDRRDGRDPVSAKRQGPSPSMPDSVGSPAIAASRSHDSFFKHKRRRQ